MRGKILLTGFLIYLLTAQVVAERILFYEISAGAYTIEKDYSQFADELRKKGFEVASIEKGELTKEKLENYDILIVQDLNKQLTTGEISSIIWFVLQKGRGLFINGGGKGKANQLTIPFGATVDSGILIDTSDQIPALNDRNSFTIDRFVDDPATKTLRQGVSKIGFYDDSGVFLSGNANCIATGNTDTYSDTGSFAAGSFPCIASASLFGGGLVLTVSDADVLANKYLDDYNNKNFGMNIIDWLSLATQEISEENNTNALHLRIKEMRLQNLKLNQDLNKTVDDKKNAMAQLSSVSLELATAKNRIEEIEDGYVGPFRQSSWAMILLGISVLIAAIIVSKKKGGGEAKIKDEDILNELGYELDEPDGGGEGDVDDDLAL